MAAVFGQAECLEYCCSGAETDFSRLLPSGHRRDPDEQESILAKRQAVIWMADDAEPEPAVLSRVFERAFGRPPHGNTAQDERTSAVGSFAFVVASLFTELDDCIELLEAPPRYAR